MTDHPTQPARGDALEELRRWGSDAQKRGELTGEGRSSFLDALDALSATPAQPAGGPTPAEAAAILVDLWANLDSKRKHVVIYAAEDEVGMGAGGWDTVNSHGIVAAVLSAIAAEAGR